MKDFEFTCNKFWRIEQRNDEPQKSKGNGEQCEKLKRFLAKAVREQGFHSAFDMVLNVPNVDKDYILAQGGDTSTFVDDWMSAVIWFCSLYGINKPLEVLHVNCAMLAMNLEPTVKSAPYVYILEMREGLVKIGFTRDHIDRFRQLKTQTGDYPTRWALAHAKSASKAATALHKHFASHIANGEFFGVSFETAVAELQRVTSHEVKTGAW